jgi:hypothetical protein
MRGELGVDSKSSSYLENPRTLKILVGEVLALNSIFRPEYSRCFCAKGFWSLSEVWAWWPLVANLVEAMVARFLTSVQSQIFLLILNSTSFSNSNSIAF